MIISIKYVIRFAKAEMIYEMPYSRGTGTFKSRLKLYSFQAEAGTYTVSLNDEVRIRDKACAFLVNAVTKRPVDYSLFSVQVYRHTSGMVLSLCVLGIIFGAVVMVSGAILPAVL